MTNLRWEAIDLTEGILKVVSGKSGKTASVNLSATLISELEQIPLEKRTGFLLPSRSRVVTHKRLVRACRPARVRFKDVHALRHASGTRLLEEMGDITLTADHLSHSSRDTARGYAKRSNQQLKKAVGQW